MPQCKRTGKKLLNSVGINVLIRIISQQNDRALDIRMFHGCIKEISANVHYTELMLNLSKKQGTN